MKLRHRLEAILTAAVRGAIRFVPMSAVRAIGRSVGTLIYLVDVPHRRTALENLENAFPGRPPAEGRGWTTGSTFFRPARAGFESSTR